MNERIHREFTVNIPLEVAWQHFTQVEQWPSWAKHIKQVQLEPPGQLTPTSRGTFHLSNGIHSSFQMVEYNYHQNWLWAGPFLWLTIHYDHRFEAVDSKRTKLTFIIFAHGFAEPIFGRLFAAVYNRNLNKAIPNLAEEMETVA